MPLPVVLSGEAFAALSGIITARNRAVKLLLLLMPVVDVSLKMCFRAEALAAIRIRAFVVLGMVSLVMSMTC